MKLPACFTNRTAAAKLKKLCQENDISPRMLEELYRVALPHTGSGRARGINEEISRCLRDFAKENTVSD